MCHYTHFTTEERELSRGWLSQGFSFRAIARKLKRSVSSVSREFRRNSYADGTYAAHHADKLYRERRKNCGRKLKLNDEITRKYVIEKMELLWSPEQIAGRAKLDKEPFSISYATIYRALHSNVLPARLKKKTRLMWHYKKHKADKDDKRGKIPDTLSIHERPLGAENRSRYGHWEGDSVLGKRKTGCLGTHVERISGFLVCFKRKDLHGKDFASATIQAFKNIPDKLKKSLTVDNGKEFLYHKDITAATGMKVYFCDPYSPWQRGTNENTNGLLRQFFPKGTSFAHITDELLAEVVDLINNRPRKRLGFLTPSEVLKKFFH